MGTAFEERAKLIHSNDKIERFVKSNTTAFLAGELSVDNPVVKKLEEIAETKISKITSKKFESTQTIECFGKDNAKVISFRIESTNKAPLVSVDLSPGGAADRAKIVDSLRKTFEENVSDIRKLNSSNIFTASWTPRTLQLELSDKVAKAIGADSVTVFKGREEDQRADGSLKFNMYVQWGERSSTTEYAVTISKAGKVTSVINQFEWPEIINSRLSHLRINDLPESVKKGEAFVISPGPSTAADVNKDGVVDKKEFLATKNKGALVENLLFPRGSDDHAWRLANETVPDFVRKLPKKEFTEVAKGITESRFDQYNFGAGRSEVEVQEAKIARHQVLLAEAKQKK